MQFLVGSDDGHEELVAAANAVINAGIILESILFILLLIHLH